MLLQGMPDLRKHDPKKYLDSLHVSCSYTSIVRGNAVTPLLCGVNVGQPAPFAASYMVG